MIDWIVAALALAVLGTFVGIIGSFVPHPDLLIVLASIVVLAGIDFVRDLLRSRRNGG